MHVLIGSNGIAFRPHDLLWVTDTSALTAADPLPPWAAADWLACAPVVMRREKVVEAGSLPVGLRGKTRSQRCKAYLARDAVARCVTPEMLARDHVDGSETTLGDFAALAALRTLAPLLDATGLSWGPTGGVGFALASGLPVLRPDSDLDLVVRAFAPLGADVTKALRAMSLAITCRLDMQIETGHGAFSFAEWVMGHRRVLLKTEIGPFLTDDPWNQGRWLNAASESHA